MPSIPPDVIRASIKPGSVYYFYEESFSSPHKHYFVVINKNPKTDEVILLACASSQIDRSRRRRRNCPPETLVIITQQQYDAFTGDTIFDCNRIIRRSIDSIMDKYLHNELSVEPEMKIELVEMLREGIMASHQIEPRVKAMLRD